MTASKTSPTVCDIFTLKMSNLFVQFGLSIRFVISQNSTVSQFYDYILSLMSPLYGIGDQYFDGKTISRWLPTKTEEWFIYPRDEHYTLSGIKPVFQQISEVNSDSMVIFPYIATALTSCFQIITIWSIY